MKARVKFSGIDPFNIPIVLPASKSMSNRALILNALSGNNILISNLSDSSDTLVLNTALSKVLNHTGTSTLILDISNAGTSFRFLTAFLSISKGSFYLDGDERMKARPVAALVNALRNLGAEISYQGKEGFPPLLIKGAPLKGGQVEIDGSESSQFVSALCMIAPFLEKGLSIHLINNQASLPYLNMTIGMMKNLGINILQTPVIINIPPQSISNHQINVEPDWSAASYWFEIASLLKNSAFFFENLIPDSLQGDSALCHIYGKLGIKCQASNSGIRIQSGYPFNDEKLEFDLLHQPDIFPALAVTLSALNLPCRLTGLQNLDLKESKRLTVISENLNLLGYHTLVLKNNVLEILKAQTTIALPLSAIPTFNDHRIAMSFAALAVVSGTIDIENPSVVNKSYPSFWEHLTQSGFNISFTD